MILEVLGALGLVSAAAGVASGALLHPASPLGRPVRRLASKHLALTFDDGPDPTWTPQVLDRLERIGARASFFVLGDQLDRSPDLVRACARAGHRVEVHGFRHRAACFQRPRELADELTRMVDRIEALTGRRPFWYRPPYGARPLSRASFTLPGLRLVTWSWSCGDWAGAGRPPAPPRASFPEARQGDIALLHDGPTPDPAARARTLSAIDHLASCGLPLGPLLPPSQLHSDMETA